MAGMSPPTQPDLGILLLLAYQAFVRDLHGRLAEEGFDDLGRSDGFVFRALDQRPMTVGALGERLQVSKQAAGQIVDDMQRRGYVRRGPDPDDGRARLVHLSDRGREALAAARRVHDDTEQRLRRDYGDEALAGLRAVLAALAGGPGGPVDPLVRPLYL
jgi:DNA-binding MarR family transcriptional regulator